MRRILLILAVGIVLTLPVELRAAITTDTVSLNQSNVFADGINYGQVVITADNGVGGTPNPGLVAFTVTAFTSANGGGVPYSAGSNFGIQTFGFNTSAGVTLPAFATWTGNIAGWSLGSGNQDGFGSFLQTLAGTGSNRQNPLTFSFTLANAAQAIVSNFENLSTGNAGQGNQLFAAHVAGFTSTNGVDSHFIGGGPSVVPEPASLALWSLLGGAMVLAWKRRRG